MCSKGWKRRRLWVRPREDATCHHIVPPVGQAELDLIRASGFRAFPSRLPDQRYFYPVVNIDYATQIARDWNAKYPQSGYVGYGLRFQVDSEPLDPYRLQQVGDVTHRILDTGQGPPNFDEKIVGTIEVIAEFRGVERG